MKNQPAKTLPSTPKSQQLAADLVADLVPVTAASVRKTTTMWLLAAAIIAAIYLGIVGFRTDLLSKFSEWRYSTSFVLLTTSFLTASWLCIASAFPGLLAIRRKRRALMALLFVSYTGWLFMNLGFFQTGYLGGANFDLWRAFGCCARITLGTTLPAVLAAVLVARLSPMNINWSAGIGAFSASLLVSIISHLNCAIDSPWHVFIGHGLMMMIMVGVLFFAARSILKRLQKAQMTERLPGPRH